MWLWAGLCLVLPAEVTVTTGSHQSLLHGQLVQNHG